MVIAAGILAFTYHVAAIRYILKMIIWIFSSRAMNRFGESDSKAPENVEIPGLGGGVDVSDPPPMFDEPNFDDEQVEKLY